MIGKLNISTASDVPCPFCGSEEIYIYPTHLNEIAVYCNECDAEGPHKLSETDAIKAWETRAS